MRQPIRLLLTLSCGVALGLGLTWLTVERGHGFGAVRAGPWTAWPRTGSPDADPYARAVLARSGEIPLALAEGLTFTASVDSRGAPLDGACAYRVTGRLPQARYWTLTLTDARGRLVDNEARRHGFVSREVLRDATGAFDMAVGPRVAPGNWLPSGRPGPFALALRLYDTPVSATAFALDAASLPAIERGDCT